MEVTVKADASSSQDEGKKADGDVANKDEPKFRSTGPVDRGAEPDDKGALDDQSGDAPAPVPQLAQDLAAFAEATLREGDVPSLSLDDVPDVLRVGAGARTIAINGEWDFLDPEYEKFGRL